MPKKQSSETSTAPETGRTVPPVDPQVTGGNGKSGFPFKAGKRKTPILVGAVVIAVLVLVLIVVGIAWIVDTTTFVGTDDASIDGQKVNISAKMLGRIKSLEAAEGAVVKSGQVLVLLDDADLRAQEAQAAAQIASAKVNRDGKDEDLKRTKSLYSSGAATKQQYDAVSLAYDAAAAQYNIAQAQLGVIETQLMNTRITSPIDGAVTKPAFSVGDVVQPSQIIFTVNNPKLVWVTANFEETKIGRIAEDAAVDITVDAYPGTAFKGKVTSAGSGVLPAAFQIGEFTKTTKRIPIRIDFTSLPEGVKLLPGMSVEVKVRAK
jgi:membrane fusion protein (multidrug efflux system)